VLHPLKGLSIFPRVTIADLLEKLREREAQLAAAREQARVLEEANRRLLSENEGLKRKLDDLCRRLYGKRSEQVDPAQLALALEALAQEEAAPPAPEADTGEALAPSPGRKVHGRRRPAKDLPRVRVVHMPAEADCVCATGRARKVEIGEEVSEQYDYEPASMRVLQHVRKKLACPACRERLPSQAQDREVLLS
jgi:transposase